MAATAGHPAIDGARPETAVLARIERRVLWLATRIVDFANNERNQQDALKVGGHQASSASLVTLMTALYLHELSSRDRVSVKPHAAPVLHALEYLLGRLDGTYLKRLRDFGGLQAYPSRTKDPFPVDYSTGSVGLGSAAPLFGALADRYVSTRFGKSSGGRFVSLIGDAELDEGNIWEAVGEPLTQRLNNVLWIIDFNRQSLDRVVPGIRALEFEARFAASGWDVIELKYGNRLRRAFNSPGGAALRRRIDEMSNEQYQSLFGATDEMIADALTKSLGERDRHDLEGLLAREGSPAELLHDLAGHDFAAIFDAFEKANEASDRPCVIFAYTIKGYGLEIAGHPQNHSALLSADQIERLRTQSGLTVDDEWDRFPDDTDEGRLLQAAAGRLRRDDPPRPAVVDVPVALSARDPAGPISTQAAFGRALLELTRIEGLSERLVTVSPDVSVSTNLGGFINKVGVWGHEPNKRGVEAKRDEPVQWRVSDYGQHIEVGIAEMNLALLLGQLGLCAEHQGETLLPIGTLYDPFVMRALEGLVYSVYSGSRFVIVGTPSGISLSREGGAHQSLNTPGIGIETPQLAYAEPCFARELEWLLLDGLRGLQDPEGEALYLRLSTTPIDQAAFTALVDARGEENLRADVVRGGFQLRRGDSRADQVVLATCGAMVPTVLEAAQTLEEEEEVGATVVVLSSPDRLYRDWKSSATRPLSGFAPKACFLQELVGPGSTAPAVTVIDGASHALAWIGSALGVRCVPLGVDRFGQTGSQLEVYGEYGIDSNAIVLAALGALEP